MNFDDKFEKMCTDVYNFYCTDYTLSREQRALAMLRSPGEFWTPQRVSDLFKKKKPTDQNLSFLEFRRLVKEAAAESNSKPALVDSYGNRLKLTREQVNEIAHSFDAICNFYGNGKEIDAKLLYNILTGFDDPLPPHFAKTLLNELHVYKGNVTTRDFVNLIGRRL